MEISFLSPAGAAVALVALFPLTALLLTELRARRVRGVLGLGTPGRLFTILLALSIAAAGLLVGAAAAEPVARARLDAIRAHRRERLGRDRRDALDARRYRPQPAEPDRARASSSRWSCAPPCPS